MNDPRSGASRRQVLVGAAGVTLLGCRRRKPSPEELATTTTTGRWGGLDGQLVSALPENEKGGPALVLLHGFRNRPDSDRYLRGARVAAAALRMRVFLPAAIEPAGDRRAWWGADGKFWPLHAGGDEQGDDLLTPPPVAAARAAVQALLRDVRARYAPSSLCLAGYSQGAMLAADVALARNPPVDKLVVLSGLLLAASLPALRAPDVPRSPVFIAHGRKDQTVPFRGGELLRTLLEKQGHAVTFRPFDGPHSLPPREVFDQMLAFLKG
jgi:predicted esterase